MNIILMRIMVVRNRMVTIAMMMTMMMVMMMMRTSPIFFPLYNLETRIKLRGNDDDENDEEDDDEGLTNILSSVQS